MPADVVWRMLCINAKAQISHSQESKPGGKKKESTGYGQVGDEVGGRGQRSDDFKKARVGDSIIIPFKYDLCVFRKLRGHSPRGKSPKDELYLACIRRMHLDTFWIRATTTVSTNKNRNRQILGFSNFYTRRTFSEL